MGRGDDKAAGKRPPWLKEGWFQAHLLLELTGRLPPGQYTLVFGILLDGNALDPPASILRFRVDATGVPG